MPTPEPTPATEQTPRRPRRDPTDPAYMSFGEHLDELRGRLILALIGIAPILAVSLAFGDRLLGLIILPAQKALAERGFPPLLQSTGPFETFGAYIRVALIATMIVGLPWAIWQLWLFVAPGLYRSERRFAMLLAPMSLVLSILALVFVFLVMLPAVLAFFVGFGSGIKGPAATVVEAPPGAVFPVVPSLPGDLADPAPGALWFNKSTGQIRFAVAEGDGVRVFGVPAFAAGGIVPQYRVSEYVSAIFSITASFVLGFQTPVVVLLLGWVGIIDRPLLTRNRRYVILATAVLAAVLTPPDPVSMLMLGLPLYGLFELGILLLALLPASRVAGTAREPASAGDA